MARSDSFGSVSMSASAWKGRSGPGDGRSASMRHQDGCQRCNWIAQMADPSHAVASAALASVTRSRATSSRSSTQQPNCSSHRQPAGPEERARARCLHALGPSTPALSSDLQPRTHLDDAPHACQRKRRRPQLGGGALLAAGARRLLVACLCHRLALCALCLCRGRIAHLYRRRLGGAVCAGLRRVRCGRGREARGGRRHAAGVCGARYAVRNGASGVRVGAGVRCGRWLVRLMRG